MQRPNYTIDEAIHKPARTSNVGRIYIIQSTHTSKKYVGQTIQSIEERFTEHLVMKSKDSLRQAFKLYGEETFEIRCLEDNVPNQDLHIREQYYIDKYNTMEPNGFNRAKARPSACGYGKAVEWEGKKYSSHRSLQKMLQKERPDLQPHIIEKRIRKGLPLPDKAREHSKHPMAGTNIFRRWLAHLHNGNLCEEWSVRNKMEEGFEVFFQLVGNPPTKEHKLCKIVEDEPFSAMNFQWLTAQEERIKQCGKQITIFGITYATTAEAAKSHNVAHSTLMYRLEKGQTPEEAVSAQEVTTQKKTCHYDGLDFVSKNEMFHYIAEKFNITFGQAKDRYSRGLSFDKPSHAKQCIVDGIHFKSESEAARHFGINKATFGKRRFLGWTLEESLGICPRITL